MKYLGGSFSLVMPGGKTPWPFERPAPLPLEVCAACGAWADPAERSHAHGADASRPRKRVCFWR